jgi:hypothetical protein
MSVPLSQLLAELPEVTRNSTIGALDNTKRTRAINRVLEDLQDYADWDFTKRTKTFYFIDGVYEYSLENYVGCTCQDNDGSSSMPDFKNPYDLRPVNEAGRSLDFNDAKSVRENIRRNRFNFEYSVDNDLLIVGYPRQVSSSIHNCDSLTENGTWAASGDATNLTIDDHEYEEGAGALNFDVSAGTSLVLTNSTINAVNLESLQNKSHFVIKAYLPTITNFTSIKLRWGSSNTAYWEKTETVPAGNRALKVGWNTFAFRWASATETTPAPDVTAIDYLQITLTYSSSTTDTDFRIDDIRLGKEVEMELDYYSLAMVKDLAGDYQLEFNPDSVTQTDELLGTESRRTVVEGTKHELFEIIGGKSERDRTDSFKKYETKKVDLLKRCGHRIRRQTKVLNFRR